MAAQAVTTLNCFVDLGICPVSYDIVPLLVQAKIAQRKIGATRMHVSLVGEMRKKPQQYDDAEAEWRLHNIVIPAAHLFDATVSVLPDWLYAERLASAKDWKNWPEDWRNQTLNHRHHLVGGVIAAAKNGAVIPHIHASFHARRAAREWFGARMAGLPVVTMTLRNTYLPERNADRKVWDKARTHIVSKGYAVVQLEDTSVALREGKGYGELNLDLRAATYTESVLNLQSNNGAASLCWFSSKSYRMFGAGVPADEWDGLFVKQGLPLGESWPWALAQQRIVYGETTAEQIIAEFEDWHQSKNEEQRASA